MMQLGYAEFSTLHLDSQGPSRTFRLFLRFEMEETRRILLRLIECKKAALLKHSNLHVMLEGAVWQFINQDGGP